MIAVEEARARIVAAFAALPAETVGLREALGRILATDVTARRTQPPVDVSAMDGWAVRAADVATAPVSLRIVGSVPAGGSYERRLQPGEAVRIFTGAPVPAGADAIVIQEDAEASGDRVTLRQAARPDAHIRRAGLDFRTGDPGLQAGRIMGARDISLAAAMNVPWLEVRRKPRVAVLATGNELVRPGEPIGPNQIVSSNTLAMVSLVRASGGEAIDLGIAPDEPETLAAMAAGAKGCDLLLTLGGASVGDHDLIHRVLGNDGASIDFWRIAMRPGKPLMFGRWQGVPLLGLPGNPVSALVCGLVFLLPALKALLGLPHGADASETALLGRALGANDRRQDYLRATLSRDSAGHPVATPFEQQDSSMLSRLAAADCLVIRPPNAPPAAQGTPVPIIRLAGSMT